MSSESHEFCSTPFLGKNNACESIGSVVSGVCSDHDLYLGVKKYLCVCLCVSQCPK